MTKTTIKTGTMYRQANLERMEEDQEDSRRFRLSFSSEEPVERFFGQEILDHAKESVDLEFLNSGRAPLLLDHKHDEQIGVIENSNIIGKRGQAIVRFGKSTLAQEIFEDVRDGIRSNISVGYRINEIEEVDKGIFRAINWSPLEVSVVSIPADTSVGIGRSENEEHETTIIRKVIMSEESKVNTEVVREQGSSVDVNQIREQEINRIRDIETLAAKHNSRDLANEAIARGTSVANFKGELLERIGTAKPLETPGDEIGLSPKETQRFSISRAINALVQGTWKGAEFERECSDEVSAKLGKQARGFYLPADIQQRDLTVGVDTAGGYLVEENFGSFIELLRNAMVTESAGATILNGLQGDVALPKQTGGATAYWVNEGGALTESNQTFGQIKLVPKTCGAFTDLSRKLIAQSSLDVESLITQDLSSVVAIAVDLAGINGAGASGEPLGILNQTGIGSKSFSTGGDPTYAEIIDVWTEVAKDNALMGNLGYITNSTVAGNMKVKDKSTSTGQFVYQDQRIDEYPVYLSEQVPADTIIFGNWSDLVIGFWTGMDVLVDPYTGSTTGNVRVRVMVETDVAVRHVESFAKGS